MIAALIAFIPSTACIISAGWIAGNGQSGWGWFLFVAVLFSPSFKYKNGSGK